MLWNYHHEFGSCLLLEHSLISKIMHQIWTFNFLMVMRQHILGVVGDVTYCFVGNLTDFPAVKEFWKSVEDLTKLSSCRHNVEHSLQRVVAYASRWGRQPEWAMDLGVKCWQLWQTNPVLTYIYCCVWSVYPRVWILLLLLFITTWFI